MTTQELTKEVIDLKTDSSAMSQKVDEACLRLGAVEREVKEQGKLLQSIDRLAMGITRLDEKITDLGEKVDVFGGRINVLELAPATKWDRVKWLIVSVVLTAVAMYLLKPILP